MLSAPRTHAGAMDCVRPSGRIGGHRAALPMQLSPSCDGCWARSVGERALHATPQQYPAHPSERPGARPATRPRTGTPARPTYRRVRLVRSAALDESRRTSGWSASSLPSHGRSVVRYRQVLDETLGLDARQCAILAVLLLRGAADGRRAAHPDRADGPVRRARRGRARARAPGRARGAARRQRRAAAGPEGGALGQPPWSPPPDAGTADAADGLRRRRCRADGVPPATAGRSAHARRPRRRAAGGARRHCEPTWPDLRQELAATCATSLGRLTRQRLQRRDVGPRDPAVDEEGRRGHERRVVARPGRPPRRRSPSPRRSAPSGCAPGAGPPARGPWRRAPAAAACSPARGTAR